MPDAAPSTTLQGGGTLSQLAWIGPRDRLLIAQDYRARFRDQAMAMDDKSKLNSPKNRFGW